VGLPSRLGRPLVGHHRRLSTPPLTHRRPDAERSVSPLSADWVRSFERTGADAEFVSNYSGPARRRTCQRISSRRGLMAWTMVNAVGHAPRHGDSDRDQIATNTTIGHTAKTWNGATGGARAITSENVGFWSRPGMSEDPQLPRGLGLGTVMCP